MSGVSGKMMTFKRLPGADYKVEPSYEDIAKIANKVRKVPDEFINERGNNVTKACLEYIAPLIEGETAPLYRNGIPVHFTIEK